MGYPLIVFALLLGVIVALGVALCFQASMLERARRRHLWMAGRGKAYSDTADRLAYALLDNIHTIEGEALEKARAELAAWADT